MGHATAETDPTPADPVLLRAILRLIGTSSLLALIFVVAPASVFDSIHASLGLGPFPEGPIVGYLARSTSAFYAILGGLFWVVSFDPPRYRRVLVYLGAAIACLGLALLVIDWKAGLPPVWTFWEGPFVTGFGLTVLTLSRRL